MTERKIQTSFWLYESNHEQYKKLADEIKTSFTQLVREALEHYYNSPNCRDPTKAPTEWENILQRLREAQKESIEQQDPVITEIIENQKRLEDKINNIMDKFEVEQPTKDKSGKRVFDE